MKKHWLIVITLFGATLIFSASLWLKALTPETVLTRVFDMNEPTRYVFVADDAQPHIAVVDLFTQQQTTTIVTDTIAQVLALNKSTGQLAYASTGGKVVYLYDISSHEQTSITLDFPVTSLLYIAEHAQLVAVGAKQLLLVDSKETFKQTRYTNFLHIKTVHYSPLANALWVIDEGLEPTERLDAPSEADHQTSQRLEQRLEQKSEPKRSGAIIHYAIDTETWTRYNLPSHWQHFSRSALSPDGDYLLFGVQDRNKGQWQAVIWQTATQQIFASYPVSAPLIQPYIDSLSMHFLSIDTQGQGRHITLDNAQTSLLTIESFQTVAQPQIAALAWLDTRLLVGGEHVLGQYSLNDLAAEQTIELQGAVVDLFITADSKTALFLQEQTPALFLLNARDASLDNIALENILQPKRVIMGASNTLCH